MSLRIEIQPDATIEIMIPRGEHSKFLSFDDPRRAIIVLEFLIKREIEKVRGERFVPQLERDARAAFKELQKRSPHNGKETQASKAPRL